MTASTDREPTSSTLDSRTARTSIRAAGSAPDGLNPRTTSRSPSSTGSVSYAYRADGMRVGKVDHTGVFEGGVEVGDTYANYCYDPPAGHSLRRRTGQMPMQTFVTNPDGSTNATNQGLGARGLDIAIVTQTPNGGQPSTTTQFPIFDAHGNQIATISRAPSLQYAYANQRAYGAWGEIRQGAASGGPSGRYCGNLGHVQDDENGLIYMRARYYEPASGRFVSEDPEHDGINVFCFAQNKPGDIADPSGGFNWPVSQYQALLDFMRNLKTARSSLDVETFWAKFVKNLQQGYFFVVSGGGLDIIRTEAMISAGVTSLLSGTAIALLPVVAYVVGTLASGFYFGSQITMLAFGYQLRLSWYIDDIDDF